MMISDLPWELESEILSRVPTKSLVKWKTACKRWYTLFKDPRFIKKNFGKAANEVILLENFKVYSISVNLHGIQNSVDPSVEFTGQLHPPKDSKDVKISQICHCEGLILCSTEGKTRLVVWNPCTGETKWIKPRTCYKRLDEYALGFGNNKSSCHTYKILRFCFNYNDQNLRVAAEYEIYDFSSDSWRVLDDVVTHNWGIWSLGVTLKGNGYWVAGSEETGFFMLNFDFTTERFGRLPLPFQSDNPEDTAVLSVVREEQLSVIHQDILAFSNVMRIWVTNKIDEENKEVSWNKFFVVDFDKFNLPSVANVKSFLVDEDNKLAVCCDSVMGEEGRTNIYIVGEDIHRVVYKDSKKGSKYDWPHLVNYVPSLVQIQK